MPTETQARPTTHMPTGVHDAGQDTGKSGHLLASGSSSATAGPSTPALQYKTLSFKVGQTEGLEPDCFQGYAATSGNVDETGDVIAQGAFLNTIADFLQSGVICWQHDWMEPLGKPLEVREDGYGLFLKARISDTARGRDALTLLRDGVVSKMSIGYQPLGYRILSDAEGQQMLGADAYDAAMRDLPWYMDGVRVLTDIKLYEVSIVSIPANPRAQITGVKDTDSASGPLAGLPFADHFARVLAAHDDLLARVKSLSALRKKEGRVLSAVNQDKLQMMCDSLSEHVTTLEDLLAACAPAGGGAAADPDGDAPADAGKSLPAPSPASEPQTKGELEPADPTPDELAADMRRELALFLRTEARLLGVAVSPTLPDSVCTPPSPLSLSPPLVAAAQGLSVLENHKGHEQATTGD